jgi:hypothetical protein
MSDHLCLLIAAAALIVSAASIVHSLWWRYRLRRQRKELDNEGAPSVRIFGQFPHTECICNGLITSDLDICIICGKRLDQEDRAVTSPPRPER